MRQPIRFLLLLAILAALLLAMENTAAVAADGPIISEFVAGNDGSLLDEDGDACDWIEIHNPGAEHVNLDGWTLTDDLESLFKWRFPHTVLDPGAYLVVFASEKSRAVAGAELHTNFKLSTSGESLVLVAPGGRYVTSVFAPYPPQRSGFSFGRSRKALEPKLVERGSAARLLVPQDDSLGLTWTGGNEPFDDEAPGWIPVTLGVGYPGGAGGGAEPPLPVAYYSFDGNTLDGAGGRHNGEPRGGPSFSSDVPLNLGAGKSLSLDGADDFVSAPLDVSEAEYTLSIWFKADTAGHGIFAVVGGDLGANGHDRHLYLSGANVASRVWNDETIVSTGKNFVDRRWHHAAHVYGGWAGGQRIYIDGLLVASGAKAASDFDWQERINIGFSNDAVAPYFDGFIDDVSIWDKALTESQIRILSMGAHPLALAGYAPWIATDLEAALKGTNASAYMRVPFGVTIPGDFNSLVLRVRFDDGFAAYLNGTEVARRNAPAALAFNSQALADRPTSSGIRAEEIDLAPYIGLLMNGGNVLAFHCLNDSADGGDFLLQPELLKVAEEENLYLSPPTPGESNSVGVIDFVADTVFSVDRGFYRDPFDVEITTATPGADVYYTTNGSAPSPTNPAAILYTAPVRIAKTTMLRAAAFKQDYQPTNVDTQTYIFPAQIAKQPAGPPGLPATWAGGYPADYGVDSKVTSTTLPGYGLEDALLSIPTLSLTADPEDLFGASRGIYSNSQGRGPAWERAASIELIRPDGTKGFQADCGIRMHGNSSRDHGFTPKHPIRLRFRAEYGQKRLKYPLFEDSKADSFDELLLRGCSTDSWPVVDGGFVLGVQRWAAVHATYFRDQYMRDAQIAMGQPSCHGTHVHLFLDGLYWGIYNMAERPVDSFCANYLGGEKEEYDVFKDFVELDSGNYDAWNAMMAIASAGLGSDEAYMRIQGRNPDGTRNPSYPVYLDVDNLMDYMILHITSGAEDWPHHNWWGGRRRGPESTGFKFFVWDQEISNDSLVRTHTLFETRFEDPCPSPSPSYLYGQCMANASFRRSFGDRVHRHLFNGGLLSPEKSSERWLARQKEIDVAIVGESARWGDSKRNPPYKREVEWLNEMSWMRDHYWPEVHEIAVERFRRVGMYPPVEAPKFEVNGKPQHGGEIASGDPLTMRVPVAPRRIEVPIVTRDETVSAFVPLDHALGDEWRLLDYSEGSHGETWMHGQNGVGYENSSGYETVIHIDTRAEMFGPAGNTSVYVRIPFSISDQTAIDTLDGLALKVLFDDGFAAYLSGVRVAEANAPAEGAIDWNSAATTAGIEASLASPTVIDLSGHMGLLRPGANLLAIQAMNSTSTSSDMLIVAELVGVILDESAPAGTIFYTLDGRDPADPGALSYGEAVTLEHTVVVKARSKDGADWSALSEAIYTNPADLPLRLSEVHYHPAPDPPPPDLPAGAYDSDELEFLELVNVGAAPLSLAGIRLEGGVEFDFSSSAVSSLGPGERLLLVENAEAFGTRYEAAGMEIGGQYSGRLSNDGERLVLKGPLGETLLDFAYDADWYPETRGGGPSLVIANEDAATSSWGLKESWGPSAWNGGSPGEPEPGAPSGGLQLPADSNQDAVVDISDAVSLLLRLFGGLSSPLPCEGESVSAGGNLALHDANGDGAVDLSDAIHVLRFIFRGGPGPALGMRCARIEGCPSGCRR